jgi:FixJ family two-component response regulator
MSKPTVYIVDDDLSARQGLTRLVKAAGMNVESHSSARDFLDTGKYEGPGCIILDVKMPGMTGPELQEQLSTVEYCMPIIFLSGQGDVPTTANVMKKGAVDFLTKPVDRDELFWAIRVSLAKDKEDRMKMEENLSINGHIKSLTPREYEIMTYVITGMLNKQIAAELFISEETVKIHRGRMMHKLEIVSVAELVHHCEQVGIAPAKTKSRKL